MDEIRPSSVDELAMGFVRPPPDLRAWHPLTQREGHRAPRAQPRRVELGRAAVCFGRGEWATEGFVSGTEMRAAA